MAPSRWRRIAVAALAIVAVACARSGPRSPAAIAMPDRYSADAAAAVLAGGGNAVDAAVAAAFVLAVTFPEAGNIGGGGFLLARVRGEAAFLDFRETAPAAAGRDMYLDARGEVIEGLSLTGHRAVAVPGTVAGLAEAHAKYGSRPWDELLAPAIALARDGFVVPPQLVKTLEEDRARLEGATNLLRHFGGMRAGEAFAQPDLAATLARIAEQGAAGFHAGDTARLVEAEMRRGGGIVTAADLAAYRPRWRPPLTARWRGFEVISAPPPSSGGFAVIQLLKMKDALADAFAGAPHNSPQYVHLTAEMEKRVFLDRAQYLGDPDFAPDRAAELIADDYVRARAAEVDVEAITPVSGVRPGLEPHATTHLSIVDHAGDAVAMTLTLNTDFGSGVVVEGAGFLLNNEMDDFSAKPGVPNYYGVVGAEANAIAPGKRMLSSMSPTLLVRDGDLRLAVGTMGGSTIITSVYQAIVNLLDFGMDAREAVAATRFHHQLLPAGLVTYSVANPLPPETVAELRRRGYDARPHDWEFGDLQLVWNDGGQWQAASDPRGRGVARVID